MKIVIVSGYFDPLHVGHIELLEKAVEFEGLVLVLLNSDRNARDKKGYVFMPYKERETIMNSLWSVDLVKRVIDTDGTCIQTLKEVRKEYPKDELIFAKGGDRRAGEIPETPICKILRIKVVDGLGKKIQSSRGLVKRLKYPILEMRDYEKAAPEIQKLFATKKMDKFRGKT